MPEIYFEIYLPCTCHFLLLHKSINIKVQNSFFLISAEPLEIHSGEIGYMQCTGVQSVKAYSAS